MYRKVFKAKVINKESTGVFFVKYSVTLEFEDGRIVTKNVPEEDFYLFNLQGQINIPMYSLDNLRWYFSIDEIK